MGIRHLDKFVRKNIRNAMFTINIEDEIRKYCEKSEEPPIIVIDLLALYAPLSTHDTTGLYFGGRFNLAFIIIDEFFTRLQNFGAKLEFFYDGQVHEPKSATWCERQDGRYKKALQMIKTVESGICVDQLRYCHEPPLNFKYPLKYIAKKYGNYNVVIGRECDQELAAYATKVNALAIIADDSDFFIYEGNWRYWSSRDLKLYTLITKEYDRNAVFRYLDLSIKQMPLFATLSGNDVMSYDTVKNFHHRLERSENKFLGIAKYIRSLPQPPFNDEVIQNVLFRITNNRIDDRNLLQQFRLSLDTYSVNIQPRNNNPTADPLLETLIRQDSPFIYLIWQKLPLDVSIGIVDMRFNGVGRNYGTLQVTLISRMAGIILFHRKPQRPTQLPIIIKMTHHSRHQTNDFTITYPCAIEPPTLEDLLSKDPVTQENLRDIKFKLLAWVASDTLNYDRLRRIPQQLDITAYTLYYLLEQNTIHLFEADLFMQVAYDVAFKTYDVAQVTSRSTNNSRAFQVVFFYQRIYALTAKAFYLVGMDDEDTFRDDPPFDGLLFHNRYSSWSSGKYNLDCIREWRIYKDLVKQDICGRMANININFK